jgi:hypothetical protein
VPDTVDVFVVHEPLLTGAHCASPVPFLPPRSSPLPRCLS